MILKFILSVKIYSLDRPDFFDELVDFVLVDRVELDEFFTAPEDLEFDDDDFIDPEDLDPELLLKFVDGLEVVGLLKLLLELLLAP